MTNVEFIKAGQKITGFGYGYQKVFAFILGISLVSVKRYATGKRKIPAVVVKLIEELQK